MFEQIFKGVVAGGYGNHGQLVGAGRFNVPWGVAYDAYAGTRSRQFACLARGIRDQLRAHREAIAESAEAKPFPQPGLFNLDPANDFQIACGDTEQGALVCQVAQGFLHARHQHQLQLLASLGHVVAHTFKDGSDLGLQHVGGNARMTACLAQDGGICAAVQHHTGKRDLESGHAPHRCGKRFHMHPVAAAQERAVDVEQVCVLSVPGKSRFDCGARFAARLACLHALGRVVSPGGSLDATLHIQDARCGVDA